jgi:hypothetical protein
VASRIGRDIVAVGSNALAGTFVEALSGSGPVTFGSSTTEQFFCNASSGDIKAFAGNHGIELVFQKLDSNTNVSVPVNP